MNIRKITGYDFDRIGNDLENVVDHHNSIYEYFGNTKHAWVEYISHLKFDENEYDTLRDPSNNGLRDEEY
jgi:hypothetical protein